VKREEQRVLAGSLNILTPSDKTIENDAIDLVNMRVDQEGVLRGGDSFTVLTNVGSPVHTVVRLDDYITSQAFATGSLPITFGGAGAFLIGAGTSLFYYNVASNSISTLSASISGNPLSIVLWNGFIWVMDSAVQIKIDPYVLATNSANPVSSWVPAPPTTAITATADTSDYTGAMSGNYTYFVTFAFYYVSTDPATGLPVINDLESAPGPSVAVTAVNGIASIESLPTYTATFAQIRLYRAGGTQVNALRIKTWSGSGSYPFTVSASSPYIDYASDASIAGNPIAPTSGAAGAPPTPTAAPTAVGGAVVQSTSQNIYTFYETFVNQAGLESNPGPSSNAVQSLNGIIHLTNIQVSSDSSTLRRRIYAIGGTLGQAYQIDEITDNTTTTYDALVGGSYDLLITENGIIMPTTNDPPPTSENSLGTTGLVGPYFNTLLAWKNARMYWSQDGVPLFPGSEDGSPEGNWVDVGSPDDLIQSITLHALAAVIHKQRSVWILLGDPVTGNLGPTASRVGTVAKPAATNGGSVDFLISKDGLFLFDLNIEHKQSQKIEPVFMGVNWIGLGSSDLSVYLWTASAFTCVGFLNGTLLISDGLTTAFIYHIASGRWAAFQPFHPGMGAASPISAVCAYGSAFKYWLGDHSGNLLQSSQQVVTGQRLVWQTRFLDQGMGDTPKIYQEIVIDAELNGATAVVYVLFDNTETAPALSTIAFPYTVTTTGTARQKFYMQLSPDVNDNNGSDGSDGQPHISVRIEITCVASATPPAIHGLYIYYGVEERDASMRGTQVLDFSTERISLCRKLEVDAAGQVDLAIWTDTPGGTMASRFTVAGPALGGRGVFEVPMPPNLRGRLWRVDVIPQNTTARVYRVRGWMRVVGEAAESDWAWRDFIDGTPAETPDAE
jgi:hypothetical protein